MRKVWKNRTKKTWSAPYRSGFEERLHKGPLKGLPFEPIKIPYIIEAKYTPDFVNEKQKIIFEAKGRFESSKEAAKYIHFRKCNPDWEVIFIFEAPTKPMPFAKKRKDGTKFTHAEWADKNSFRWFTEHTIPKELLI